MVKLRRPNEIKTSLQEAVGSRRRDQLLFSGLTILLTPFFLALAIFLLLVGVQFAGVPILDHVAYPKAISSGFLLLFFFVLVPFFLRGKSGGSSQSNFFWAGGAAIIFIVLCFLTYGTSLPALNSTCFWIIFGALGFFLLALLGHAHEPRDDYYLGLGSGTGMIVDNPFTFQDDADRFHLGIGVASMIPNLIVKAYSEVFGSLWIWKGLTENELSSAAKVIHRLATKREHEVADLLATLPPSEGARVVRVLIKMKYIITGKEGLFLNDKGEQLAGVNKWL